MVTDAKQVKYLGYRQTLVRSPFFEIQMLKANCLSGVLKIREPVHI
ncbi:hypothetical protein SAMN05660479_01279 [Microbulbifer thermotolerans]|nr:hypothetical protein SAMN05660479_01279 [Microbulbifer thermotolerans]